MSDATFLEYVVFFSAAVMILGGAIGVITMKNPVHAALGLVLTLFGVAVQFVAMDAQFLAAVQVIVYAGAIVVLFLFVIMLLGVDESMDLSIEPIPIQRPLAAVMAVGLVGLVGAAVIRAHDALVINPGDGIASATDTGNSDSNVRQLASNLVRRPRLRVPAHLGAADRRRCRHGPADPQMAEGCSGDREQRLVIAVIEPTWYLLLAAMLFGLGAFGLMVRRNPLIMFMCVELMLNAANLTFVALATRLGDINGQTVVFFVMVVAAAEVVVGLGIIVSILRRRPWRHRRRPRGTEGLTAPWPISSG